MFDTRSFYQEVQDAPISIFLWKGIWKVKVPKMVAFFIIMWTAALRQILTLDNLMIRCLPLVNWCCMCRCNGEYMDYLLLHCVLAHALWVYMFQIFGIQWVMPGSVASLLFCWRNWLGKYRSNIWNLVPSCLMWIVWTE